MMAVVAVAVARFVLVQTIPLSRALSLPLLSEQAAPAASPGQSLAAMVELQSLIQSRPVMVPVVVVVVTLQE